MTVRTSAVAGVSRVLEGYWEIIPANVIKALLKKLIGDLARDANSVNVRVAVIQVGVGQYKLVFGDTGWCWVIQVGVERYRLVLNDTGWCWAIQV